MSALLITVSAFHIRRGLENLSQPDDETIEEHLEVDTSVIDKSIDNIAFDTLLSIIPFILLYFTWREARRAKVKKSNGTTNMGGVTGVLHVNVHAAARASFSSARARTPSGARASRTSGFDTRPFSVSNISNGGGSFVNPTLTASAANSDDEGVTLTKPAYVSDETVAYTDEGVAEDSDGNESTELNITRFDETELVRIARKSSISDSDTNVSHAAGAMSQVIDIGSVARATDVSTELDEHSVDLVRITRAQSISESDGTSSPSRCSSPNLIIRVTDVSESESSSGYDVALNEQRSEVEVRFP